ncbi:hypothetical protein Nepgr_005317 [Nepenthes gracilis]|uniref:Uncharacterized protein n=1 Tax=Nepenthes gracilis TaxID=150966 RepID=A0AAD3XGA8_NEPGR|nr:hypothetical protein Nepgr_005317 [Nepenthes gracilis]
MWRAPTDLGMGDYSVCQHEAVNWACYMEYPEFCCSILWMCSLLLLSDDGLLLTEPSVIQADRLSAAGALMEQVMALLLDLAVS